MSCDHKGKERKVVVFIPHGPILQGHLRLVMLDPLRETSHYSLVNAFSFWSFRPVVLSAVYYKHDPM